MPVADIIHAQSNKCVIGVMGVKIKAACDSKCNDSPAVTWKNWFIVFFFIFFVRQKVSDHT